MRFFDTNVLVYAASRQDPRKREIALGLLRHALEVNHDGVISLQILQEFTNVMLKRSLATDEQIEALKADKTVLAMLGSKIEKLSAKDRAINMQLFRKFASVYIRSLDKVDPQKTLFVRELNSTGFGIPLEIYLFTTETAWADFETFGSDIVDYLMSKLPLFGLKIYQRS